MVLCVQPAYLALQDALSIHGLWEQETIPVIITTRKVRQGLRSVFGSNIMIRRIDRRYYFGIEHVQQDDVALPVSNIEKTLPDLLYYKQYIRPDVLKKITKRINRTRLIEYLKLYPAEFGKRVKRIIHLRR